MSDKITARVVEGWECAEFMYSHFGSACVAVETGVYTNLDRICDGYHGGMWEFVELSNGGAYMRLDKSDTETMHIVIPDNYTDVAMSVDAASITANLFAMCAVLEVRIDDENLFNKYYWLKDYAEQHSEAAAIGQALVVVLG